MRIKLFSTMLTLLLFNSLVMAEGNTNFLIGTRWTTTYEIGGSIEFRENRYDIEFAVGGYYSSGDYLFEGNRIILFYPETKEPLFRGIILLLDWLFRGNDQVELVYDPDYIDFNYLSCLRNDHVMLGNIYRRSPAGQVYTLQGVEVIKYNWQNSMVLIQANLRMREAPSVNAGIVTLTRYVLNTHESFTSHLVYRNTIKSFDAITVREDTIDGITAPWYRIIITLDEIYHEYVWVFGGYLRELERNEINNQGTMRSLWRNNYQALIDMGLITENPIWQ